MNMQKRTDAICTNVIANKFMGTGDVEEVFIILDEVLGLLSK